MKVEIDQIKAKQNEHHRILAVEEEHHHNIEDPSLILVHIADHFVAYYKQFLVGQVVGVMASWFVDILCLVQVYSVSGRKLKSTKLKPNKMNIIGY
jgi:hypothetical protein